MKILLTIAFVVFGVSVCIGQITSSSAYDPNVYLPRIGIEIDTIYGSKADQELGGNIWNTGVPANGKYGKVMIGGLQTNPPFLSAIEGGPDFDIQEVKAKATRLNIKFPAGNYLRNVGHFRNSKYIDALVDTTVDERFCMFWSDADGNFDSSRVSFISLPKRKGYVNSYFAYPPYIGYMTSDTVEDFVFGVGYHPLNPDNGVDTASLYYYALYRGGASMNQEADTVFPDSLYYIGYSSNNNYQIFQRYFHRGDFDGDGRIDVIARGGQDLFFYSLKNPFSLAELASSLFYDTLYTHWQNPSVKGFGKFGNNVSPSLVHKGKTKPADILLTFDRNTPESEMTPYVYIGGSEFGKKRLYADSADYKINVPRYYDNSFLNMSQTSARVFGDITGTGHNTLNWEGYLGEYTYRFFYVLGKEQDDKADMVSIQEGDALTSLDTITADEDLISDLFLGTGMYETPEDFAKGKKNVGTLQVIHGSSKIPVKLSVSDDRIGVNKFEMSVYPNPATDRTTIMVATSYEGTFHVRVRDVLGRSVFEKDFFISKGNTRLPLSLSRLTPGTYFLECGLNNTKVLTPLTIVH